MSRSPEAKRRRAPARDRAIRNQERRVACDNCKTLHAPPACPVDDLPIGVMVMLPPRVAALLRSRVPRFQRSAFVAKLIDRELS